MPWGFAEGIAAGLRLRHNHGSQYVSHFQAESRFLRIDGLPAFAGEPDGNGCSCYGSAASAPLGNCAWRFSPYGRPTANPGSSSGMTTGQPPRPGPSRPRPYPWPLKRRAVAQNCGPVCLLASPLRADRPGIGPRRHQGAELRLRARCGLPALSRGPAPADERVVGRVLDQGRHALAAIAGGVLDLLADLGRATCQPMPSRSAPGAIPGGPAPRPGRSWRSGGRWCSAGPRRRSRRRRAARPGCAGARPRPAAAGRPPGGSSRSADAAAPCRPR